MEDVQIRVQDENESKKWRVPADMLVRIPVEDEEKYYPGMPISPGGGDMGADIRI